MLTTVNPRLRAYLPINKKQRTPRHDIAREALCLTARAHDVSGSTTALVALPSDFRFTANLGH
jgi:hypothetical protein